jgi:tetratricopeptide (TPR) repeat protein
VQPNDLDHQERPLRGWLNRHRWLSIFFTMLAIVGGVMGAVWWSTARNQASFEYAAQAVQRGDFQPARAYLSEARSEPSAQARAAFLRGAVLLKKTYLYPALDELRKVDSPVALRLQALTLIGEGWYHLGRHVEVEEALQEVIRQEPNSVAAHRWLAASYYDAGAIHSALRHLQRTAELDSADPRPHRLLGLIHKDYEQYEEAIPQYEESLRRSDNQPDGLDIRIELAGCQIKVRRYREALITLATCPVVPAVLVLRAECHYGLGSPQLAKQALELATKREPNNLEALLLEGTIFLDEGNTAASAEVLERAAKSHPMDYLVHFKLAQAYHQLGNEKLAEAERRAAENIRALRKEFSELHQAAWDRPHDGEVRLRLASLAKQLNRPDLAEVWLRSAAALQPLSENALK